MNIIFFGTHNFAASILQGLLDNPLFNIQIVITQPDRPVGRKKQLQATSVKLFAKKHGLKIDQPESLKDYVIKDQYDLNIVVDYGLIIPKKILEIPKFGSINIHPSLLPKYRGASPMQTAILNGDKQTGVSIMLMDAKMDHGPILAQKSLDILPDDTYPSLSQKLAAKAKELLVEAIPLYIEGKIKPKSQDHDKATFTKLLDRQAGLVDFNKTSQQIYDQYRALAPWPGIWAKLENKKVKFLKIQKVAKKLPIGKMVFENKKIYVGCRQDSIEILELQLPGKKPANAADFVNGYTSYNGLVFNL